MAKRWPNSDEGRRFEVIRNTRGKKGLSGVAKIWGKSYECMGRDLTRLKRGGHLSSPPGSWFCRGAEFLRAYWPSTRGRKSLAIWVATSPAASTRTEPIPEWERNFGLWPQIQIAACLNPLRFENRKPNSPLFTGDLNSSNRKPAGRNRRIRAARRPQIAESPATRPLSLRGFARSQKRTEGPCPCLGCA